MSEDRQGKDLILAVNSGSSSLKISLYRIAPAFSPTPSSPSSSISSLAPGQEPVELLLVSTISNLSAPPASFSWKPSPTSSTINFGDKIKDSKIQKITSHTNAFTYFLEHLKNASGLEKGAIGKVCHRVVHGGDYVEPEIIDDQTYERIQRLSDLAPLHNGAALTLIKATLQHLPSATSIAYFDTIFHRTIPPHIYSYAIDPVVARERGLRKYGFHGLSYAYILRTLSTHFTVPVPTTRGLNLIIMHLGSGASMVCIKDGKSFDTTMGLTPVSGLPGATRCGNVDPSLVFHWYGSVQAAAEEKEKEAEAQKEEEKEKEKDGDRKETQGKEADGDPDGDTDDDGDGKDDMDGPHGVSRLSHRHTAGVDVRVTIAEEILNRRSGWKAMTGTTNFGEIVAKVKASSSSSTTSPDEQGEQVDADVYTLAFNLFLDRLLTYIGSYYLKLGGEIDALVFAGGIGEKSPELREAIGKRVQCLGFSIDLDRNANVGNAQAGEGEDQKVVDISENWEVFARSKVLAVNIELLAEVHRSDLTGYNGA
ncbi:unnamed protein product [Somion occarium]|uniref:Probable acetate kinase n=1 Tax=Somion occarium TaxID=3059160 RepID=A0ABP1EBP2_9APHY